MTKFREKTFHKIANLLKDHGYESVDEVSYSNPKIQSGVDAVKIVRGDNLIDDCVLIGIEVFLPERNKLSVKIATGKNADSYFFKWSFHHMVSGSYDDEFLEKDLLELIEVAKEKLKVDIKSLYEALQ